MDAIEIIDLLDPPKLMFTSGPIEFEEYKPLKITITTSDNDDEQ